MQSILTAILSISPSPNPGLWGKYSAIFPGIPTLHPITKSQNQKKKNTLIENWEKLELTQSDHQRFQRNYQK